MAIWQSPCPAADVRLVAAGLADGLQRYLGAVERSVADAVGLGLASYVLRRDGAVGE